MWGCCCRGQEEQSSQTRIWPTTESSEDAAGMQEHTCSDLVLIVTDAAAGMCQVLLQQLDAESTELIWYAR